MDNPQDIWKVSNKIMYCLQTALLVNLYWRAVCHEPRPEGGVFVSEDEFIAEAPELIGVTRIKCDANAATSHANTDFTSLLYVYKGRGQCSLNGVNYTVKDGDMVVLSPDISYRLASVQDKPLRAIRVSFSVKLNGRDKNRILAPDQLPVLSLGKYQQLMGSYFEQICEESDNPSLGAKELLRSIMQAVTIRRPHGGIHLSNGCKSDGAIHMMESGGKQMSERILESILGELKGVNQRLDGMDQRFVGIDQRFDGIDKRFDRIETTLDQVKVAVLETHE
jgi:mannose-6-phosphate isomerase-like protein (cupin superfamily)